MRCKKCGHESPPDTIYCVNCGSPLTLDAIPQPGVGSSLSYGWRIMWRNFWGLFLSVFIYNVFIEVIVLASWIVYYRLTHHFFYFSRAIERFDYNNLPWEFNLIVLGIGVIIIIPLSFGIFSLFLGVARGEKIKFNRILDGFRNYPSVILVSVTYYMVLFGVYIFLFWLTAEISGLGIFLSIVWSIVFIVLMCRLLFVPFLITDRKMKGFSSIETSWSMSSGHAGQAFGIGFVMFLVSLGLLFISWLMTRVFGSESVSGFYINLGIITLLVILASVWFISAFTSLYYSVSVHDKNNELKDKNDSTYQLA